MKQPIIGSALDWGYLNAARTELFCPLVGCTEGTFPNTVSADDAWSSTSVIPRAGTLYNLRVQLKTAPGAGTSWICTLRVNGVDKTLVATVSGTGTTGSDTTHTVTVAAGDRVGLHWTKSGSPASSYAAFVTDFESDDDYGVMIGATGNIGFDSGSAEPIHCGNHRGTLGTSTRMRVKTPGTLKYLYVRLSHTQTFDATWTVQLNGDNTAITVTIAAGAVSGNDTAHEVTIADGDLIGMVFTRGAGAWTSTAAQRWGLGFKPDTPGRSFIHLIPNTAPSPTSTNYMFFDAYDFDTTAWSTDPLIRRQIIGACELSLLNIRLSTAPGSGNGRTFTVLDDGSPTAITVTLTGTETEKTYSGASVAFAAGSTIQIKSEITGSPGASTVLISAVCAITEAVPRSHGFIMG